MEEEVKPNIIDNNGTSYYTAVFTKNRPFDTINGMVERLKKNGLVEGFEDYNVHGVHIGIQQELIDVQKQCNYFVFIKASQALEYVVRFGRKYYKYDDLLIELKKIEMNIDYCLAIADKLTTRLLPNYIQDIPVYSIHTEVKELLVLLANEIIDMDFLQAKKVLNMIKTHYPDNTNINNDGDSC